MATKSPKDISRVVKDLIANQDVDHNYEELLELKALLSSANGQQVQEVLQEVNVSQFCADLNAIDGHDNIDIIVNIFDVVFGTLSPQYVITRFSKEIVAGFDAKDDAIVELWLKTLDRCLTHELALNHTISDELDIHAVLVKVIALLAKPKTSTAKHCHSIVLNIAKTNALGEKFFEKDVQNLLIEIKTVNDIIRMRVYELLVSIASTSHKTFYRVESFGHLKALLDDFNTASATDPLLTMNILQIMTDLGSTSFGTEYLQSSDILKTIAQRLENCESDLFGNLLIPGYIKIFGNLAANEPKVLDNFPIVLTKLKALLDNEDSALIMSAIDAIAAICHKNAGKAAVDKNPELSAKFLSTVSYQVKSGNTDHKVRALNAVTNLLTVNEPDVVGHESTGAKLAEKWFQRFLPDERIATLLRLSKEPFPELRVSALECLRVVAGYVWGQKELAATPGFLEYIMDRSTETAKEGKEAKYAVVKELVRSPTISESFTKEAVIQLRAYYKDGPYYVGNETAVSFEAQ